ncbi:sugar transporter-domain-containing protein [Xylariaceae sp. FL0255]|nr:sugar transporter-domain-containing protein [Xylariaceae sp. FL0255]
MSDSGKNSLEPKGLGDEKTEYGLDATEHVNINSNTQGRIANPLKGIPRAQLMRDVEAFAQEKGLSEHLAVLKKGALVAQNPDLYEEFDGEYALTETEKEVLRNEKLHKWRLPWRLYLTIVVCSIGAAVQGWDQTGSNGASIFFPAYYGIDTKTKEGSLLVGVINSAPYISSALVGCWLSDPFNNYIGRRGTIFVACQFLIWPVIGSAFALTWQDQFGTRLLMGIGMGIKGSTVPIFAAENSPASVRGALVMSWQMWTAFGIFLGTVVNVAVYYYTGINWRLMLGAPFIPAVPLALLIYFCPESPRWLMKKNRYAKAWKSLNILRFDQIQSARDMYQIHAQLQIEHEIVGESNYITRWVELFTIPRVRRATIAAFTVMLAQQLCGINIIAFYSTTVFTRAGFTQYQALLASLGFGAVNWIFAFPAFFTIDTFGRRALLLFTFPNMFWTLLAAALSNLASDQHIKLILVALFVYLFAAFYSPGEGPVPFAYSAEVFPLSHREVGMGFAVATCLGWAAVLSITFPLILDALGVIGAFGLYAGFNVLAFIMIFFLLPETKQRTLEELDYVFAVPNHTFAKYQLTKAAPWWFKRYVFFQRSAKLEPLYHQDDIEQHQAMLQREKN